VAMRKESHVLSEIELWSSHYADRVITASMYYIRLYLTFLFHMYETLGINEVLICYEMRTGQMT